MIARLTPLAPVGPDGRPQWAAAPRFTAADTESPARRHNAIPRVVPLLIARRIALALGLGLLVPPKAAARAAAR
jgi:hypothetical protein